MDELQVKTETTFLDRLLQEETELIERTHKLNTFLNSDKVKMLSFTQHSLLLTQVKVMEAYASILDMRIKDLNNKN